MKNGEEHTKYSQDIFKITGILLPSEYRLAKHYTQKKETTTNFLLFFPFIYTHQSSFFSEISLLVFCLARVLKKEEKVGKRKKKESTPTCIIVIHMHIKTIFVCLYYCVAKKK